MGTRSTIGIKEGDKVKAIYCHWDGYLSGVGVGLLENYTDTEKVAELIALGGISSLRETIGETAKEAYGGESDKPREFESVNDWLTNFNSGEEFAYLYEEGKGWVYFPDFTAEIACPLQFVNA